MFTLHRDNYVSVFKGGKQLALIHKDPEMWMEQNEYDILYSKDLPVELVVLFTAWVDQTYFRITGGVGMWGWEKTVTIFKNEEEERRIAWVPEGDQ